MIGSNICHTTYQHSRAVCLNQVGDNVELVDEAPFENYQPSTAKQSFLQDTEREPS